LLSLIPTGWSSSCNNFFFKGNHFSFFSNTKTNHYDWPYFL
jgi:hypothetical protein